VVIDCQAWGIAFADETKAWAVKHGFTKGPLLGYIDHLKSNYPWPVKNDPVPSWRKRLDSLMAEKDDHLALKKYCDFMRQTGTLRDQIGQGAGQLDGHIQEEIDRARGK